MKRILLSWLFIGLANYLNAQQAAPSYYLPAGMAYDTGIPTPESYLGWPVGEWHATHDQVVGYLRELDKATDRISLEVYGRTHEARPLLLLTVTGTANRANLEAIKTEHAKLSDAGQSAALNLARMPAVVWIGASVHGNEPSGVNAMLLLAYHLAAAQGPALDSLLNETVILLDPAFNPDGVQRFAHWANTNRSKTLVTDPDSREFNETWPGGRFNHYGFDLNRDWLYVQHPESQGRAAKFQEWKPNILTDHHEMGSNSTFFFQPGVQSRVHPLTPKKNQELTQKIGRFHARALDKIGSLYFTEENYDDFYYGKGSTYPDVQGCVGILFEQGSSRGHAQQTDNGLLTFPFTIRNQFTTMLSTLAAARALRVELLSFQRDFYKEVAAESRTATGYVFGTSRDAARNHQMLSILLQQKVNVYPLKNTVSVKGIPFAAGSSYYIPAGQPQYRLIKAMFEKRTRFDDSLFYDISAFSLPLAFHMPHAETSSPGPLGERLSVAAFPAGTITGDADAYAYLLEWNNYYAPRALHTLLEKGYRVRVATKPFTATVQGGSRAYDYGTLLVAASGQPGTKEAVLAEMQMLASRNGLEITGVASGLTASGIDFGSGYFTPVTKPEVMMLVGTGTSPTDAGEVWHLLDTRCDMPPVLVDMAYANRVDLWKYNTIVLAGGTYNGLNANTIGTLKRWVQDGGTLVAISDAIPWAVGAGLVTVQLKKSVSDSTATKPYALIEQYTRAQDMAGAIFQARLDRTHPLGYGYADELLPVFKDNTVFMEKPKNPYAAPLLYTPSPLLSGYVSAPNLKRFAGAASVVVQASGTGRIILLADNPNFRAFWYGTNKLFLNALFFGRLIAPAAGRTDD